MVSLTLNLAKRARVNSTISLLLETIAKHTKVGMIWVAGRSPTLVSQNLKATTLTYLAIPWTYDEIWQTNDDDLIAKRGEAILLRSIFLVSVFVST